MASDVDASCENDPNFAVVCAFFEKFGENCGLGPIDFSELQSMLENTEEVPPPLASLLIKLMRKVKKTVKPEKWEKALVGLCHNFSSKDAWEIERFGFKKAKLSSKVRALKELLEMQFDFNVKFKGDINKLTATELRSQPLGRDKSGHAYWFHSDHNFQIRVYKEDLDDETWTLIAKDRESLVSLITKLNDGEVKCSSDSAVNEDSNSLSEKLIIDTGQIDSDSAIGKGKITEDDDVEQMPKEMKIGDNLQEERVLKIHLTDIQKSPKKQECDKFEETDEKEEIVEEEKEEKHEFKKANNENSKSDEETSEKSPIVGDVIEEDTMHVQGEGSGRESEAGNGKSTASHKSPIVGEVIEEETMYIRGEGNGKDCETGNDEKASVIESQSNDVSDSQNSGTLENSIREDEVDEANNGKSIPKVHLGKVDSSAIMSPVKVESEKKPTFFFGSPLKETSVNTSLTMEFGQKHDLADKCPSDIIEKEKSHIYSEEDTNEDYIKNEPEIKHSNDTSEAGDENQNAKVNGKNDEKNSKDDEPPDKAASSNKLEVVEEPCVKKHAYVCGNETTEENEEIVTEKQKLIDDVCNKSIGPEDYKLDAEKPGTSENIEKSKEMTDITNQKKNNIGGSKPNTDNCELEEVENKLEDAESGIEDDTKTECDKIKPKVVEGKADHEKSDINKPEEIKSEQENEAKVESDRFEPRNDSREPEKDEDKSDEISIPGKSNAKPGMALRAVRTKRAVAQSKCKEKHSLEEAPAKDENIIDTEIVYVKSRRGKKEREVTPPTKTKNVKKPKLLVKEKNKIEDKVDSDNASVTSEGRAEKGSMASASSSRVSTPVSMPDSIITIPEITEVTSIEEELPVMEKDPLGCSDDDQDNDEGPTPNAPANLQNFSFDYDDTSATPAIPVIPTTRSLRKRGREASPVGHVVDKQQGGKKMKLKGKRRFNTKLRKSIEQQKQQLHQPSSSDEAIAVSSDEAPKPPKEIQPKKKRGRKKKCVAITEVNDDSSNPVPTVKVKKERKPNARMLEGLGISDVDAVQNETLGVRQSRRLAQIKIKESLDVKKPELKSKQLVKEEKLKKKSKEIVHVKKKHGKKAASPEPIIEPEPIGRRKKKKSVIPSKLFDQSRPWRSSSESSEEEEEAVEEEEEEEVEEKLEFNAKSDHEFSPESDLESEQEYQAPKRARTAKRKDDSAEEDEEDFPCEKCGKSDHPEWILLCDKCENGWHCSCLRPPLLSIPEGDWFCPPCEHIKLIENLQHKLNEYDKNIVKKNLEDRRKERLAYVGISLNNVLPPSKDQEKHEKIKKNRHSSESGSRESGEEDDNDDAESETDSDEPVYQLRQRRQARSYKFNEYDDLINSAIQDQLGEPVVRPPSPVCGRGKDMATIVKAEQEERKENDVFKDLGEPKEDEDIGSEDDGEEKISKPLVKPPVKKARKKTRKMTALDVSSEDDDERDEDFIGDVSMSSEDEDVDEEDSDEDSDDIGHRRKNLRSVRRSTRARASKIDKDFIDDDDDDDDDDDSDRAPRKKKKKHYFSDEESSASDGSWGRRKKKGSGRKKKSNKKNSILDELSDLEVPNKKKKRRIVYGGLTSSEEELGRGRRTRGKKTTYVEALGSETEDEVQKRNPRKIDSDDEDFVANEEEDEEEALEEEPEPEEDEYEEEVEENIKKGSEERRRLMVPKIYIKKPATGVAKETDKNKKENSEINKYEDKANIEQNDKVSAAHNDNERYTKPDVETKSEGKKSISLGTNNSNRVRIKVVPRKETLDTKSINLKEMNKHSEKINDIDVNKKEEKDLGNSHINIAEKQLDSEKKKLSDIERINMKKVMSSLDKAGIELTKMPAVDSLQKMETAKPTPLPIHHEPIVSNVNALLKNDDSNDELSEPPGVTLPVFDEVSITKKDAPRRRIKIRPKKSLEETVAHLGSAISIKPATPKPVAEPTTTSTCKIEIAAPPQPFSQTAPAPSIITRMLQTPSGATPAMETSEKDAIASSTEPVRKPDYSVIGKIRPKQFATMPLEDDEEPPAQSLVRQRKLGPTLDSQDHFVQNGGRPGGVPPPPQYHHRLPSSHSPMSHYPPHQPPPHEPACGPLGAHPSRTIHDVPPTPPQSYPKEPQTHVTGSPAKVVEGYGRLPQNRYSNPGGGPIYTLRPPVHLPHAPSYPSPQPSAAAQTEPPAPLPPQTQYYGNYPPPPVAPAEEPPYSNPPYHEGYGGEPASVQEQGAENSKSYEGEETGGEFGGLVSYFSSQHEDDLDS